MAARSLETVAQALVADGKGILAADETVPTLTKRFQALGIQSTGAEPAHVSANASLLSDDPPHRRDWRDD